MIHMPFCPHCGKQVQIDEKFCITCGKALPNNLKDRYTMKKSFLRHNWKIPIIVSMLSILILIAVYYYLNYRDTQALQSYEEAEQLAMLGDYEQALSKLNTAINYKNNFPYAKDARQLMEYVLSFQPKLEAVQISTSENNFESAFSTIYTIEKKLNLYMGTFAETMQTKIKQLKTDTQIEQLHYQFENKPTMDQLKTLIWEAEAIDDERAELLAKEASDKFISEIYQEATKLLERHQFNSAISLIDDAFIYLDSSDTLLNLQSTIQKEKVAFESYQQQLIQHATDISENDTKSNKQNALKVKESNIVTKDNQVIVTGKLLSTATVPIHSIKINYAIYDNKKKIVSNQVYLEPDQLYPNEEGKFEFIHFDIDLKKIESKALTLSIEEIKWYID